jgi:hypothetical protein
MTEEQPNIDQEIPILLKQAQAAGGDVGEFAWMHVWAFRDDCQAVLLWQRTEGCLRVIQGEEPDVIRQETEARIDAARTVFHGKLRSLLDWAGRRLS